MIQFLTYRGDGAQAIEDFSRCLSKRDEHYNVLWLDRVSDILPTHAPSQGMAPSSLVKRRVVTVVVGPFTRQYRFLNKLKLPRGAPEVLSRLGMKAGDVDIYTVSIIDTSANRNGHVKENSACSLAWGYPRGHR